MRLGGVLVVLFLLVFVPLLDALHVNDSPAESARPHVRSPQDVVCADGALVVRVADVFMNPGAKINGCGLGQFRMLLPLLGHRFASGS